MYFTSDNASGAAPEIMAALARANDGYARSYGADAIMDRVRDQIRANELLMRNKGLLDPDPGSGPAGSTAQEQAAAVRALLAEAGAITDAPE